MTQQSISIEMVYSKTEVLKDYQIAHQSRLASLLGRREVLTGKAKFGIFGDGKELPQIAMAKVFQNGDFRSGYYRDQTFMMATGLLTIQEFFAQLYAHTSVEAEPASAGRMMNGHFATRLLDEFGNWKNLTQGKQSSADVSPTGSQMPRLVGLAYASKLYRELPSLKHLTQFSINGNEVAFGTIGNASTAEGMFFEAINAAGVLKIPMVISIWDDEYGISVHAKHQTTKQNISEILSGFALNENDEGFLIYTVEGWNYPLLCQAYQEGVAITREKHIPAIYHITQLTQPQGHSTSGSHERYKSKERLAWEQEHDCIKKFKEWIIEQGLSTESELVQLEKEDEEIVKEAKQKAWEAYQKDIKRDIFLCTDILDEVIPHSEYSKELTQIKNELNRIKEPIRKDVMAALHKAIRTTKGKYRSFTQLRQQFLNENFERYSSHLYSESNHSALKVKEIKPIYSDKSPLVDGRQVLQACFDAALTKYPELIAFGEDVGTIGDVNKAFEGLQDKYGELRVSDTGIRECTILGQAIGAAMRGLRPIAEIQYLDYLLYAIQIMSDDLATVQYRTKGGQKAPVIVRTRGHRLEGIWHAGSPMGMIIHAVRGMYVLVPRNMTQAAGFYNTMLQSDDTALIVEVLNGYRLKERIPDNVAEFTVPLGVPEILREGMDVTLVTYGACCRIAIEAAQMLDEMGISVEVIDVQTLLPFDIHHIIVRSLQKTNKIAFLDEDVPGGATSYMMQQVLEVQNGYRWLDSKPITITAKAHRPAYGSDGDYFSKPNAEEVFDAIYSIMHEYNPQSYPKLC
ncbi:MAG: thiamine pyrophosphate-dependent enzyme [Bacteroidia bacterium]|nr:thiamine pyrophosphate-dependent enzyme [Bacteroidia bacterium]MDW8346545.1 thiamine pyrophosphate-dependent enzyme [Bacteroidia bacterium]